MPLATRLRPDYMNGAPLAFFFSWTVVWHCGRTVWRLALPLSCTLGYFHDPYQNTFSARLQGASELLYRARWLMAVTSGRGGRRRIDWNRS